MILPHYIKVAWRNLLRYKTQSIISIVGLAVGFACFVLASIWIRYELTYDTFHQDTERIYMVRKLSEHSPGGLSQYTTFPLAEYLENNLPEVELAANCQYGLDKYQLGNSLQDTYTLGAGKKFLQMFPIQIVEGTEDFLIDKADNIAITERIAKKIYGKESPIGKTLNVSREEKTIVAVVKNWPMHSNFSFDMVSPVWSESSWGYTSWHTFIKLHEGVDVEAFRQKLEELVIHPGDNSVYKGLKMTPISKIRYENPFKETALHFNHLIWFAIAGGLLVLCALFNYLNLFVTRMRIRSRELGLRKVCGSSNRHLLWLFSVEFLFTLFWAILLGLTLLELILPFFKEISEINTSRLSIYLEAIGYSAVIALLSFLVSLLPIYYFRRHSLHQMVKGGKKGGDRRGFQQAGILCQLVISIGIIFCSVVLIKQVHHLRTAEMGIARENRAVVRTSPPVAELKDLLAQIPTITEIYGGMEEPLVPSFGSAHLSINQWEGRQEGASDVTLRQIDCSHAYFDYYGFKLIAGSMPEDGEEKKVLINESAAKALGMDDPVGKSIMSESGPVITGVVQDFFISSPTEPIQPMLFHFRKKDYGGQIILLKYSEGKWKECKQQIDDVIIKNQTSWFSMITNMEEEYDKMLASENALIRILDFISVICILISLFGLFSLVTLDCEKRRKEIAIRKVNGADIQTIFGMIWKKYMLLLCLAMGIAFPIGYLIMKRWIESYVMQASIDWWIYVAIALFMALTILLCVGWRIYKAARTNPAEAIKTE